jgi:hypothetical protein
MKPYFRRSKICPSHQGAPTVLLGGVVCRFCQQCTRCHPLDEFDGTKRWGRMQRRLQRLSDSCSNSNNQYIVCSTHMPTLTQVTTTAARSLFGQSLLLISQI